MRYTLKTTIMEKKTPGLRSERLPEAVQQGIASHRFMDGTGHPIAGLGLERFWGHR